VLTVEGADANYDHKGYPSSLFVTGTIVYGLVVIMANFKIVYSTHTHNFISIIINLFSIGSFFVIYYLENKMSFVP
jgi:hypothetical protein